MHVTPVAHGQMSGCLFTSGYVCVLMFMGLTMSKCVTQNLIQRDEIMFTPSGPY